MMLRVSFDIVVALDEQSMCIDVNTAMLQYIDLLNVCGWTQEEYEKELLSRIDKEWVAIHKLQCHSN